MRTHSPAPLAPRNGVLTGTTGILGEPIWPPDAARLCRGRLHPGQTAEANAGFSKTMVTIKSSVVMGCSAKKAAPDTFGASGGAIAVASGDELSVADSQFTLNKAEFAGGAIAVNGADARANITGSTFMNNQLEIGLNDNVEGGTALHFYSTRQVTVQECSFLWGTEAYAVVDVFAVVSASTATF
jgi:hypothetical protein